MSTAGQRRTDRVSIAMPISVSGTDPAGKPFSEDASTVTVSQYGAAIALKREISPGRNITIRRLRTPTPREAECHVIGKIGSQADLHVFSVTFLQPSVGFWDIYFPALPADIETAGRIFVMCQGCSTRRIVHLNTQQLTAYQSSHRISYPCENCGKSTVWVEPKQEGAKSPDIKLPNPTRLTPTPEPANRENRRKHPRLTVQMAVCIRQAGTDDEIATTIDISRGGLCFTSSRAYPAGSYIQVAIPYSPTAVNIFVEARVVHTGKSSSSDLYRHGVMYLAEHAPKS